MSTLKTHNLQSPDAGSVNIVMAPNAGMVVAGISTFSNDVVIDGKVGIGTTGSDYGLSIREADNNNKWLMLQKNSGQQLLQIREDGDNHVIIDGSHSSGELHFYTAGSERFRIDSSGHMGLGVQPNANWPTNADFKALQIGTGACVFGRGSGDEDRGGIAVNWYSTGSANKYIGNGNAARIYLADGNIYFANAGANSSGANAAMTITDRMTINVNGDIGVNCTPLGSDPFKLDVTGTSFNIARFTRSGGAAGVRIEGNGATEAVYLSLKTLNTTANSGCVIEGVDADGNGTSWIKLYTENNSTNAGAISLHTRPASGSTTKRFVIDSAGDIIYHNFGTLFGNSGMRIYNTLSGGPQVQISRASGQCALLNRNTSDGQIIEFRRGWGAGGSISVGTNSATFNTSSDYRLKENIVPISDGIARLKTLKPSRFK